MAFGWTTRAEAMLAGVFVAWSCSTREGAEHSAQRLDSAGNRLWPESGGAIENSFAYGSVTTGADAVFFSSGFSQGGGSYIQKIDTDGNVLWGRYGVRLDDWEESGSGAGE
jgi:hypothetical protein